MRKFATFFATVLTVFGLLAASASAATYNIVGSFSGGQLGDVAFDLTIEADFSSDISDTSAGLTINSLTSTEYPGIDPFAVAGGLAYRYVFPSSRLYLGGRNNGVFGIRGSVTDFLISFADFSSSPIFITSYDSKVGVLRIDLTLDPGPSSVTEVSPVPLPAGAYLLLTGLLAAAGVGYRKKRAV